MKKVFVWILALMLTAVLILFSLSFISRQAVAPAMDDHADRISDDVLIGEAAIIREHVEKMAEICGFSADPVMECIDEGVLRDLNIQASRWWNSILKSGKPGPDIYWDTEELEQVLSQNIIYVDQGGAGNREEQVITAVEEIRRNVIRTVLPIRQQVVRIGLNKAEKRIDLQNLITFFLGIPWALLALCALLAGLIALLESRGIRSALPCIGGAMGAASLVLICLLVLYHIAGIPAMIREASASLTILYEHTVSGMMLCAGILAAVLAAGCATCLIAGQKDGKRA